MAALELPDLERWARDGYARIAERLLGFGVAYQPGTSPGPRRRVRPPGPRGASVPPGSSSSSTSFPLTDPFSENYSDVDFGWEPVEAFAPPVPEVLPEVLPDVWTPPRTLPPSVAVPVLGRIITGVLGWFWPSDTAADDDNPVPGRKGPPKRNRPRPAEVPDADDWYNWGPERAPRPRAPAVVYPSTVFDDIEVDPRRLPLPRATPAPAPSPTTRPANPTMRPAPTANPTPVFNPTGIPAPRPLPTPTALPWATPLALPFLTPGARPLTPRQPQRVDFPSQEPMRFAQPQPQPSDRCNCTEQKTKRKRKQDSCRNPIVSRSTRKKGNRRFSVITRELKCPASSKKKLRLPQVR